jgi:hypothetical protein
LKLKHYLLLKAFLDAVLVLFISGLFVFVKTDLFGRCFGIGLICFCTIRGFLTFKQIAKTREEERVWQPPTDAPAIKKVQYYKKMIWLGCVAFPALTILTVMNLNDLESGQEASVQLVAPVALLYQFGGYWIAALSVPVTGMLCILLLMRKIRLLYSA